MPATWTTMSILGKKDVGKETANSREYILGAAGYSPVTAHGYRESLDHTI
jgi:hypothetical protein